MEWLQGWVDRRFALLLTAHTLVVMTSLVAALAWLP